MRTSVVARAVRMAVSMLVLGMAGAACAVGSEESTPEAPHDDMRAAPLRAEQLVIVEEDGSLTLAPAALDAIPPGEQAAAAETLAGLNETILRGETPAFVPGDERLQVTAARQAGEGPSLANCYCSNYCCSWGTCCKSGWWEFCWEYASC